MKELDPRSDTPTSSQTDPTVSASDRRRASGAGVGLLVATGLLAVAMSLALFLWSTVQQKTASGDNAAPSLTTGSASSKPNNSGVTPPASR